MPLELMEGNRDEQSAAWADCLEKIGSQADTCAFQTLFEHFAPLIKAFARRADHGEQHVSFADEMVQETMLKIWTRACSYDRKKSSPSTWIFTIARNTRIDFLRGHARNRHNVAADDGSDLDIEAIWMEDDDDDAFHHLVQQKDRELVRGSLLKLPEEQRCILNMIYLEDKSHTEVAEELNMPLGTVKSRLRLGLGKLKIFVERQIPQS